MLRRLRTFEATARLGSIALAANELGVSASAVSHQMTDLRKEIGEELFVRSGRSLVLTAAGKQLAERISAAFELIDMSLVHLIGEARTVIRIAVCSAFGPYWLVPRLPELRSARSDLDLELLLYTSDPELTHQSADCIVTARAVAPGYSYVDLFKEELMAVAAPGLVQGDDLSEVTLITTDTDEEDFGRDWSHLFPRASSPVSRAERNWIPCSHYILAAEAAKAGLGAAVIPDFMATPLIAEGRLVQLGPGWIPAGGRVYRACFKEARRNEEAIRAVMTWLKRAAAKERSA